MGALTTSDIHRIRKDFPILQTKMRDKPLVYLDSAASAQKPNAVISAMQQFYSYDYANIHRGVYSLSERATKLYETARDKIQAFIHAAHRQEIIFVRGTTEAINLIAQSFARPRLQQGDEILITTMEHHSNIVPWQLVCEQTGAILKVVPINDAGEILLKEYEKLLTPRTRLVSVVHISNSIGTINPVEKIIAAAHKYNIPVLLDGAQAAPHQVIDVQALDCDFYAFSGHKLFGPTGIGVLYGKRKWLESMPPYHGGGDMINRVTFEKTTYNSLPYKFEAGTPHAAGAIGLASAIDYVNSIGLNAITSYEHQLLDYATQQLQQIEGLRIIGTAAEKASILSFVLNDIHAHDVGTILDQYGVAIRSGHHCTMPLMDRFGVAATTRASFVFYNTFEEIDILVASLQQVKKVFV